MHAHHMTQHEIFLVADFMRRETGNDFGDKGLLVSSKMTMLCARLGYRHFYELWDDLSKTSIASAQLRQQVIDELTTSYSYFYREKAHFDLLARLVASGELPAGPGGLRVWSAGCATGEEAYNIAMTLEDARAADPLRAAAYEVVGSDISSEAIEAAERGRYDLANVARLPPHWRKLYCVRSGHHFDISASLRSHVEFRRENVFAPRPDAPFDVVMCRNMLIYFDRASKERFLKLVRGRVRPGGYLFLGHTEIMGELDGFSYIEPSIWRRHEVSDEDLLAQIAPR